MTQVRVDADRCERTGFCAQLAPEVFRLSPGDGPAEVDAGAADEDRGAVEEAEALCPAQAISIYR